MTCPGASSSVRSTRRGRPNPRWLLGILLVACSVPAHATVWHVEHDPNQPEDRIGQVVLQAGDGDTIRVGPGTYYEHIPLPPSRLVIESTHGRESTILDGSRVFPGRGGSLLYFNGAGAPDFLIRGFTIQAGTGTLLHGGHLLGGGAIAVAVGSPGGRLVVEGCRITDNHVRYQGLLEYWGGGILMYHVGESRIVGCEFADNSAYYEGEHIFMDGGVHVIEDSTFEVNVDDDASASIYFYGESLSLTGCAFRARGACSYGVYSIHAPYPIDVSITNCVFQDEGGACARRVSVYVPAQVTFRYLLADCLFSGPPSGGFVYIAGEGPGTVEFLRNTVVGCHVETATQGGGGSITLHNNIFHHCDVEVSSRYCEILCNNAWPDTIGTRYCRGTLTSNGNLNSDPQFCEESLGDYRLARTSPCTEVNAPEGCGQIGALGVGCEGAATIETTWGRLRMLFR